MLLVSDNAKQQIKDLKSQETIDSSAFVRISVIGGGCSGLSYDLKFDTETKEDDEVFEDKGIKMVTNRQSLLYLVGTTLDFSGGLEGKGFFFENPNASRTCACGESFSV